MIDLLCRYSYTTCMLCKQKITVYPEQLYSDISDYNLTHQVCDLCNTAGVKMQCNTCNQEIKNKDSGNKCATIRKHLADLKDALKTAEHKYKADKLAYIAELSRSVSDVSCKLSSERYVYILQYIDDETALITKHLCDKCTQQLQLVNYCVMTKSQLGKHVNTQYNRYCQRANIDKDGNNRLISALATLKVMEYLTDD